MGLEAWGLGLGAWDEPGPETEPPRFELFELVEPLELFELLLQNRRQRLSSSLGEQLFH